MSLLKLLKKFSKQIILPVHTGLQQILSIENCTNLSNADIGTKAKGFSDLQIIAKQNNNLFYTPEGAFVIPFYFYQQHIANKTIADLISALNRNPNSANVEIKIQLKKIREAIENQEISKALLQNVKQIITKNNCGESYRFRSSCNAEDLENFSGAGLYDSKTGKLHDDKKSIQKAIKAVWASIYAERAYQERRSANIDEKSVMMAILAHRNFPNESINGVAITKNIYRNDFPAYIINAQLGDISTVNPLDSIVSEQFILSKNSTMNPFSKNIAVKFISYSSLHPHQSIFSKQQLQKLSSSITAIEKHYQSLHNYWDIEFKFEDNKLYCKQVRPYK
jgi:pyruvate, water dikinase